LVGSLEQWPQSGVPDNAGAWLMATANHRAIDLVRRNKRIERKRSEDRHCLGRFDRSRSNGWLEVGWIDARRVS
jgi:predicted RNA polymerase sigma factor